MVYEEDYCIRYIALPTSIHGVTAQDEHGFNNIYINTNIGIEEQRIALRHEIEHIARGDFYRTEVPLEMIEDMEI